MSVFWIILKNSHYGWECDRVHHTLYTFALFIYFALPKDKISALVLGEKKQFWEGQEIQGEM